MAMLATSATTTNPSNTLANWFMPAVRTMIDSVVLAIDSADLRADLARFTVLALIAPDFFAVLGTIMLQLPLEPVQPWPESVQCPLAVVRRTAPWSLLVQ